MLYHRSASGYLGHQTPPGLNAYTGKYFQIQNHIQYDHSFCHHDHIRNTHHILSHIIHHLNQGHNPIYFLVSPSSPIAMTLPSYQSVPLQTGIHLLLHHHNNCNKHIITNSCTFKIIILVIIFVTKPGIKTFQASLQPFRLPTRCCLPNQHHQAVFMLKVKVKRERKITN